MTKKMMVALAVADWMKEEADAEEVRLHYIGEALDDDYSAFLWDCYKYEQEHAEEIRAWEDWAEEWLADPANYDDENYSDIYKDLYGFRPNMRYA